MHMLSSAYGFPAAASHTTGNGTAVIQIMANFAGTAMLTGAAFFAGYLIADAIAGFLTRRAHRAGNSGTIVSPGPTISMIGFAGGAITVASMAVLTGLYGLSLGNPRLPVYEIG